MITRLLLYFLHRCSPEWAHHFGVLMLKLDQRFGLSNPLIPLQKNKNSAIILPSTAKFKLANRLGLGAGFDKNAEAFVGLSRLGFGFIEVGTVTPLPQVGNPRPRLWRVPPQSLINSMGFNNCGLEKFRKHLVRLRPGARCPIFANIGKGKNTPNENAIEDYALGFKSLASCVDGFVVNISSPNTPGLRDLQSLAFLEQLARVLPVQLPVFIKLSPDMAEEDFYRLLDAIDQVPAFTGVVLTNTSVQLAARFPSLKGGLSGPPLLERSLKCVASARERLKENKIIIGVGGVSDPFDYREMRSAGADLVEIYTAFVYKGVGWVKEMAQVASQD